MSLGELESDGSGMVPEVCEVFGSGGVGLMSEVPGCAASSDRFAISTLFWCCLDTLDSLSDLIEDFNDLDALESLFVPIVRTM